MFFLTKFLEFRFLFPALGGLLFGYDIGATSGATISLQVHFHLRGPLIASIFIISDAHFLFELKVSILSPNFDYLTSLRSLVAQIGTTLTPFSLVLWYGHASHKTCLLVLSCRNL